MKSGHRQHPVRVLLVEDHVQLRGILQQTLCSQGFQVTTAASGDEALDILHNGTAIDILFSDIRMPGRLDGLQLARRVRQYHPGVTIILQTGFSNADTGEFQVLRKPFTPDELCARLLAATQDLD